MLGAPDTCLLEHGHKNRKKKIILFSYVVAWETAGFRDTSFGFPRNDFWWTTAEIPYWWRACYYPKARFSEGPVTFRVRRQILKS